MSDNTPLPYDFDLLYDMKLVSELHDHLTGVRRLATSATDRELVRAANMHGVPLPASYKPTETAYDFLTKLNDRLPIFPPKDAVPEEEAVEIALTWGDIAELRRALEEMMTSS